jgi:hypothetical protein
MEINYKEGELVEKEKEGERQILENLFRKKGQIKK